MWVFTKDIPQDYWVISPRAPYLTGNKGYSWRNVKQDGSWGAPGFSDLQPALSDLMQLIGDWTISNFIDLKSIDLIGFSQGAALGCAFLLSDLMKIKKAACLAGFMPDGGNEIARPGMLLGTNVFVSHGIGDEVIPLSRGQEMVRILKYAGAEVDLCAEEVGHKVGTQCFKGLKKFFST
jgi:phospholipase/carboxylesterase